MKKNFFLIVALPFCFLYCTKSTSSTCSYVASTVKAPANEIAAVRNYIATTADSTTAIEDTASGLFYKITTVGTGATPKLCSTIVTQYIGKLAYGNTFDSNRSGASFVLGTLTIGWQVGLRLIQAGGSITLYVPPTLGYGSTGSGTTIPPNAILVFNINLLSTT
jgi:FKBP-type peptidyl-prolyl cis-trans isomerase FkpA